MCSVGAANLVEPGARSLLRHSGLAEAGEEGLFEQDTDLRQSEVSTCVHAGDARITTIATQPPGFGEFSGSALGFAFDGI